MAKAENAGESAESAETKAFEPPEAQPERSLEAQVRAESGIAEVSEEKPKYVKKGKKAKPEPKAWVKMSAKDVEDTVISLANAGHSASQIGIMLRDEYGVPSVETATEKTVSQILKAHKLEPEIPDDLMSLIRRSVEIKAHLDRNKKDFTAKRGYQLTVAKIRHLLKYYTRTKRLPKDWHFTEEKAALLVK